MIRNKIFFSCTLILLMVCGLQAQEEEDGLGTEVVNVVKPYSPTVSDAFKIKETPVLNDSAGTQKKPVQYNIFSVPVASTFTPAKGKAATVEQAQPELLYDNYASLGFGNYTTILGELYTNFKISRTDQAGFNFTHNSTQGDIDGILLSNNYFDTGLEGYYSSRGQDVGFEVKAGLNHQIVNWYGTNSIVNAFAPEDLNAIDPQQTLFGGFLGGSVSMSDNIFTGADLQINFLSDAFSSSEFQLVAAPEFMFPLEQFDLKISGSIDFLSGGFDRDYFNQMALSYGFANFGVAPSLVYKDQDLTLDLGVEAVLSLDTENSASDFYLYPKLQASYRLVDEVLIAYGGAEGGLQQNSYRSLQQGNQFVSPTLAITPTNNQFDAFLGMKGKFTSTVGYNVRASYGQAQNYAFYQINPFKGRLPDLQGYEYGNSFNVIYDDLNTLEVFGELKVEVAQGFRLALNGSIFSYNTDQAEAWNLPNFKASLVSDFDITQQWYGGVALFYVGERKDFLGNTQVGVAQQPYNTVITLDGYLDANAHLGYKFNQRLSLFVKGSNLLGDNYQKWLLFPVQGIQGLLGATYKFDW